MAAYFMLTNIETLQRFPVTISSFNLSHDKRFGYIAGSGSANIYAFEGPNGITFSGMPSNNRSGDYSIGDSLTYNGAAFSQLAQTSGKGEQYWKEYFGNNKLGTNLLNYCKKNGTTTFALDNGAQFSVAVTSNENGVTDVIVYPFGAGAYLNIRSAWGSINGSVYAPDYGLYFGTAINYNERYVSTPKPAKPYKYGFFGVSTRVTDAGQSNQTLNYVVWGATSSVFDFLLTSYSPKTQTGYTAWFNDENAPDDPVLEKDPNAQGGGAGGGGVGGDGSFDNESDVIGDEPLPVGTLADSGLVSVYVPTVSQLRELSGVLWSRTFYDTFLKMFADPMDAILGLHILPFNVSTNGSRVIYVGNFSTAIVSNYTRAQFQEVNCGSVSLPEYWGNALDYSPYTSVSIFLPFIGARTLDTDEVMGRTLSVRYKVDVCTGAFVVVISVDGSVLYQFEGTMGASVPISARSYEALISDVVRLAVDVAKAPAKGAAGGADIAVDTVQAVMDIKPETVRSGNLSGHGGFLGKLTPYLIIKRPRQSLADDYIGINGYPCNQTYTLGQLSGYTQCESVELVAPHATAEEYGEIVEHLREGVIL